MHAKRLAAVDVTGLMGRLVQTRSLSVGPCRIETMDSVVVVVGRDEIRDRDRPVVKYSSGLCFLRLRGRKGESKS